MKFERLSERKPEEAEPLQEWRRHLEALQSLETMDQEALHEEASALLKALDQAFAAEGAVTYADVNEVVGQYANETLVMRREDVTKLLSSVIQHKPLHLEVDTGKAGPYPNVAVSGNAIEFAKALKTAFAEGRAAVPKVGIATVAGFRPGSLTLERVSLGRTELPGVERGTVRAAGGDLSRDDLRFVIVRTPRKHFPEALMTEDELADEDRAMITRGYGWE